MSPTERTTELAVIGGGPGGYAAAFLAADLGMRVVLIDPEPHPGGVCLYRGCIPSKALLHVAKLIADAREAKQLGIQFARPKIDFERLRRWKEGVVDKLTGGLGQLVKQRRITYVRGRAHFTGPRTVRVHAGDEEGEAIGFDHAILATGSRPARLPNLSQESARILDSTAALAVTEIPQRLLVVGGGYIGLELGSVYAALGSSVTLVEMTNSLLPGVDADLVRPLAKRLEKTFDDIRLETRMEEVRERDDQLAVTLEGTNGGHGQQEFDAVLVAVGRRPNSCGLGLETTKATVNEEGFVEVDAQQRTAEPSIYAVGDVVGEPMLAHKASHEGRTAVEAIAGKTVAFEPHAIPAVVFTDPEIAWCGLTENDAGARGRAVTVARFPWSALGRAATLNRADGVTKIIFDPETERVLGVGITGPGAGELIAEGVLAVELAATAKDVALSIHPHPTLSESFMESAEVFFGQSTHVYRPRRRDD
jgi:dihydrolipoamide dehydrogenase